MKKFLFAFMLIGMVALLFTNNDCEAANPYGGFGETEMVWEAPTSDYTQPIVGIEIEVINSYSAQTVTEVFEIQTIENVIMPDKEGPITVYIGNLARYTNTTSLKTAIKNDTDKRGYFGCINRHTLETKVC